MSTPTDHDGPLGPHGALSHSPKTPVLAIPDGVKLSRLKDGTYTWSIYLAATGGLDNFLDVIEKVAEADTALRERFPSSMTLPPEAGAIKHATHNAGRLGGLE